MASSPVGSGFGLTPRTVPGATPSFIDPFGCGRRPRCVTARLIQSPECRHWPMRITTRSVGARAVYFAAGDTDVDTVGEFPHAADQPESRVPPRLLRKYPLRPPRWVGDHGQSACFLGVWGPAERTMKTGV